MPGHTARVPGVEAARRAAGWLFLTFACFNALLSSGTIDTPDGVVMFRVTEALVERRSVAFRQLEVWPEHGGPSAGNGLRWSKYGLGESLASVPAYLLGLGLLPLTTARERDLFDQGGARPTTRVRLGPYDTGPAVSVQLHATWYDTRPANFREAFLAFITSWTNALVAAGALAGLLLACVELGYSLRTALEVAALAGLASPLLVYAKSHFSEALSAFGLTWFVYLARRGARPEHPRAWLGAGLAIGATVLAKSAHAVLLVPAALLLLACARGLPRANAVRRFAAFGAGAALPILAVLGYDAARFGSATVTGYERGAVWSTPLLSGLSGLLVSPGRGLLWYCPVLLISALAARRFAKRHPAELTFIVLSLLLLLGLHARWYMWEGGWCWGPRYLVPLVPLLVLPAASFIEEPPAHRAARLAGLFAVALSTLVAVSGALVNPVHFYSWVTGVFARNTSFFAAHGVPDVYTLIRWDWLYAPLLRYWDFPLKDDFLLPYALRRPGLVLGCYALFAAGLLAGLRGLWRATRRP